MSRWYEVFDNDEVQLQARKQASRLTAIAAATVLVTLFVAALGLQGFLSLPIVGTLLVLMWYGTVRWTSYRLRKLRRIVWCIKLSDERVVGYDYNRRKAVLEWRDIHRIDLADKGMLLIGARDCSFEIPHLYPDFATLSHRVVHYAEMHGIPVFIDGQPWQELNVYELFPFLADGAPGTAA